MENNYSVYQHVTPDGFFYFGATSNIKRRWKNNGAEYKTTSLYPYIEKFGWDNIQHIVLFKDQTKENALWIEDFLITTAQEDGVCINKKRSGLISKGEGYQQQYYEENKQQIREQKQQYYEENKQQILEQKQQYYEENKQQIREQQKQYREQNKQQIREQKKQYYEQNKDKQKQYYEENKQQIREQQKQYYEENKQQIREQQKQYYEQNKQQRREYQRQYNQRKKEEKQLKELGCLPLW